MDVCSDTDELYDNDRFQYQGIIVSDEGIYVGSKNQQVGSAIDSKSKSADKNIQDYKHGEESYNMKFIPISSISGLQISEDFEINNPSHGDTIIGSILFGVLGMGGFAQGGSIGILVGFSCVTIIFAAIIISLLRDSQTKKQTKLKITTKQELSNITRSVDDVNHSQIKRLYAHIHNRIQEDNLSEPSLN